MKESVKKYPLRIQKKDRKKLTLFLACAVFSFVFWLLFSLSKTYTYSVPATIEFANIPTERSLTLVKRIQVSLKIEGSGWQLLTSHLNNSSTSLLADLNGHKTHGFISMAEFIPDLNQQLPPGQRLLNIVPDSIYFNYTGRSIKKVPLVVPYSIEFQKQYSFLDPVEIALDSVTLSGPRSQLAKIDSWESPRINLVRLNHSLDTTISLTGRRYPEVIVKPDHLVFSVKADQFTESTMLVPVIIENNQDKAVITVIPSHVRVFYQVPLSYYYNLRPELFEISADLDDWKIRHHNKLKLTTSRFPAFIKVEKLEPASIDFLIKK